MSKSCKTLPKTCCERYKRQFRAFSNIEKNKKSYPKKTVHSNGEKSCSTGIINCERAGVTTPKKTTKSELSFTQNIVNKIDYCKTCGDVAYQSSIDGVNTSRNNGKAYLNINGTASIEDTKKTTVQQFYKNKHYKQSTQSLNTEYMKKISLRTFLEQSGKLSNKSIFEIYPDSDEEIGFIDPDDSDTIKNIKEFRNKNYFECHSAKSRVNSKTSVASSNNHKCVYRFYLNERLFPVPLNTDYQGNIRCIECHLPLNRNNDTRHNGTVQAKVKFNDEVQDMLLVLPVSDALVINEKRIKDKTEEDDIYFGIIKLDLNGDSIFNRTLPEDSLALRYQKGYREFSRSTKYEYESVNNDDIIIV